MFHKIVFSFALIIAGLLTYPTMGMAQGKKSMPVIADRQVISYSADDKQSETLEKYYRDQEGRTRIEQQNIITINDPISRTTTVLDSATKTFNKIPWTENVTAASTTESQQNNISAPSKKRKVGSQTIEGIEASGEEFTDVISLENNKTPIVGITTMWASKKMQILVQYSYKDSLGNSISSNLKNIKTDVNPDASFFEIPTDYVDVVEFNSTRASKIQPNAVCPLTFSYRVAASPLFSIPGTPATIASYTGFLYVRTDAACGNLNYMKTKTFGTGLTIIKGASSSQSDEVYFYRSSSSYGSGGVYFYKNDNPNNPNTPVPHLINVQVY